MYLKKGLQGYNAISNFSLLFFLTLSVYYTSAQDTTAENKTSYFKAGISYLNNNVYLGRKDSVAIPYITPAIGYYHRSGLFITTSLSFLPTESRIDLVTLQGGYSFSKNKLDGEIFADKYFYNKNSYSVKSEIKADAGSYIGYDLGFIKPSFTGTVSFSSISDYLVTIGLEHTFYIFKNDADITPSFFMNSATQNYYGNYYKNRKYSKIKKGKKVNYAVTADALNISGFKLMDYEVALPFNYIINKFSFNFTPTVALPVNPNTVVITVKPSNGPAVTRTITEKTGTSFFCSAGITYKW